MKIESIDIQATIEKAQALVRDDKQLSATTKSMLEILILVITLLAKRLNLNSTNSSKPPSSDPNRKKQARKKSANKAGGQNGHVGTTLKKIDDPDNVEVIKVDRRTLPAGQYRQVGFESRQVFDIDISRLVTEYRAQILEDEKGQRVVAPFPKGVTKAVQYGVGIKAHAVYMSLYQLIPYKRVQEYFADQLQIPISEGSIFNFNKAAYQSLADFERRSQTELAAAKLAHADETGINIGGKRHWLHGLSNDRWTCYYPHVKRGTEAMNEMGVLPMFSGVLCHDHRTPYFTYNCTHALCNAHRLRELERAREQDGQTLAQQMEGLLETINRKVTEAGGALDDKVSQKYRKKYRDLLKQAEIECPESIRDKQKRQKRPDQEIEIQKSAGAAKGF